MAEKKGNFKQPIANVDGKNSFFEVFDSLDIDRVSVTITLYDPERTREQGRVTQKASFYINTQDFLGLSALVTSGRLDNFITEEAHKSFPKYSFTESSVMRLWTVKKTDTGSYNVSITEKEKGSKWEDAKTLQKASFYISPFNLVAVCKTVEARIQAHFFRKESQEPRVKAVVEAETEVSHDLTME